MTQAADDAARSTSAAPASLRDLSERLTRALDARAVLSGAACQPYSVQGCVPGVVARPADVDGVCAALALAAEVGAAVVPWGSGSRMALGAPPQRCDLVLSIERLRAVQTYDPADLTITVQAGIPHAALARRLAEADQMLPLDVTLPERATLGGTLATGMAGLRRSTFGAPRDLTLGLRVVDAQGILLKTGGRVVKNASGYDMSKLFVGALGTLGVIVEASLKLAPLPEAEGTVLGIFASAADALAVVEPLEALGVRPSAVAVVQVGAVPELADLAPAHLDYALLAARFPGVAAAVTRALSEGQTVMTTRAAQSVLPLDGEATEIFWAALDGFAQTASRLPQEALLRITALPDEGSALLDLAQRVAARRRLELRWLVDGAAGTLWLRIAPPRGTSSGADQAGMAALSGCIAELGEALGARGRACTVLDAAPEVLAVVARWGPAPPALALMHDIQRRFDPEGRLSPGRFVVS